MYTIDASIPRPVSVLMLLLKYQFVLVRLQMPDTDRYFHDIFNNILIWQMEQIKPE